VTGSGDIEKPAPVTPAVPLTDEFPVFLNVTDKVDAVFSAILPKDRLEGVTDRVDPEVARGYKFKETLCGEWTPT
jgi:hypothetical protein